MLYSVLIFNSDWKDISEQIQADLDNHEKAAFIVEEFLKAMSESGSSNYFKQRGDSETNESQSVRDFNQLHFELGSQYSRKSSVYNKSTRSGRFSRDHYGVGFHQQSQHNLSQSGRKRKRRKQVPQTETKNNSPLILRA